MADVAVVTDTCHYLPRETLRSLEVPEVSLYVHWARGEDRESDLPDYDEYYASLGTAAELPTTSQPSIGDFLAAWGPFLDAGREVVSVHLAGGISGTVESARQARDSLGERAGRVHVVDSRTACGGEGLCVLAAVAAAREGADGAGVAAAVEAARAELGMWFAIDTLEYLRRGGRIGSAQAWLGSALKVKPILTVESEITPIERVRTASRAFAKMVEFLESLAQQGRDAYIVQHIQAPAEAERLAERARDIFGRDPVCFSEIGPVIGTHVGPGLLGVGGTPGRFVAAALA